MRKLDSRFRNLTNDELEELIQLTGQRRILRHIIRFKLIVFDDDDFYDDYDGEYTPLYYMYLGNLALLRNTFQLVRPQMEFILGKMPRALILFLHTQ